jgi:hypothetical protein
MVKIKYLIGIFSTLVIILLWHSCASASVQHAFELPFSGNTYGGGQHQESFSLDPKSNNVFGSVFMESYGNLSGASLTTNNGIQIAGKASSFTAGSDPKTYINFDIYSVDKKATAITITINYSGGGMYKGEARVLCDDIMSTSDYRSLLNEFINNLNNQPEDTTPPEISICTADGRSATRSGNQVPIIIKAKDNVTPLEDLEVSIDKGATWQAYEPFFNIGVSGSGMKTIYVLVRDQAGNESLDYVQLFVL